MRYNFFFLSLYCYLYEKIPYFYHYYFIRNVKRHAINCVVSKRYFYRTGYLTSYSIWILSRTYVIYANAVTYEPSSYYVLSISLYRSPVTTDSAYDLLYFMFYLPYETSEYGNCNVKSNKRGLIACLIIVVIILWNTFVVKHERATNII